MPIRGEAVNFGRAPSLSIQRRRVNRIVLCRQSAHIVFGQNLHAPISLSPTSSFLLYPNQLARVIAAPLRFGKKFGLRGFSQPRHAREQSKDVRAAAIVPNLVRIFIS